MLAGALGLRPPDLVKMDVEGAEVAALPGMQATLARHRPILLLELHGRAAARASLECVQAAGYRYLEIASGGEFASAQALIDWFPDACRQVLCLPA